MAFGADGQLYVSLGENNQRATAQQLDKLQGKLVRLQPGGGVPADNPFVGREGVRPEIWSYGHRNPQGLALNPWSGRLWLHEHGPRGGDEINSPGRGATTAGRRRPTASTTASCRFPRPRARRWPAPSRRMHVWKKSPAIAAWPSTAPSASRPGSTACSSGRWPRASADSPELQGDQVVARSVYCRTGVGASAMCARARMASSTCSPMRRMASWSGWGWLQAGRGLARGEQRVGCIRSRGFPGLHPGYGPSP